MSAIGHIEGELTLTIAGSEPISIGTVSIPLKVKPGTGTKPTVYLEIVADLGEVRDYVNAVFGKGDQT